MSDTIKQNNEIIESKTLNVNYTQMTKLEYISTQILQGLVSNSKWTEFGQLDSEGLTDKAVELSKLLLKKVNS